MLIALRRVIRAVDVHSRKLAQSHQLTSPQAMVLRESVNSGGITAGELARRISLSQATITDIVKRLEQRGLVVREKDTVDKRRVVIVPTTEGQTLNESAPPLLQETFSRRFGQLQEWEQNMLLASIQRIANLMDADDIDAAPLLTSGAALASPADVEQVLSDKARTN